MPMPSDEAPLDKAMRDPVARAGLETDRHAALRARIAAIERNGGVRDGVRPEGKAAAVPLGVEMIDAALPHHGILRGCLHEVAAAAGDGACIGEDAAAAGFCAVLLGRLGHDGVGRCRPVLWCENRAASGRGGLSGGVYAPGLAAFGLRPEDLILAEARRDAEALWVVEEVLRTPALAAVVAEVDTLGLVESRRLQLAAEARGVTAILLRPGGARLSPTAATTRWRVAALAAEPSLAGSPANQPASQSTGHPAKRPRWTLDLLRNRGGRPGSWHVIWHGPVEGLALRDDPGLPAKPVRRTPRFGFG